MGYKNISESDPDFDFYSKDGKTPELEAMSMKYHDSWDWLMPVVEKIHSMGIDFHYSQHYKDVFTALQSVSISEVYEKIVEFIKWINE